MSIDFASPSMRAAGSDLAISISPLGLVELSDEEFEVHGPRLNRYAQNWAFYLGHHWAYRREAGEPQITYNYTKALSDFITNFTFSKGLQFQSVKEYKHIIPALLDRIWSMDNNKEQVLWDMGNQGSVAGDAFVKVAYDPPPENEDGSPKYDINGYLPPGRVRIMPLNASFCFPEWHPHDREKLVRFKLKYRFWGTTLEGTRQVYTYTEILSDDTIEEYVNDELVDRRPNPLGEIPIVHIPNIPVSGSPWGLADIADVVPLNREYNEKSTDISDILNYHANPVTIITGAKASNLEVGARKVWGGLPKDANVFNLEGGTAALKDGMEYLDRIKRAMHEMTGVPETALGQVQPISNTSGVALAIQYQPMMQRYGLKKLQYEVGLKRICRLALRTIFLFEPETVYYDQTTEGIMEDGQPDMVDVLDPMAYQVTLEWPPPLPVDTLIKLNEINAKMGLGLESKEGALRDLGEAFPDEKLQELFEEQIEDTKREGAQAIINAHIQALIMQMTGVNPADGSPLQETQTTSKPGGGQKLGAGAGKGDEHAGSEERQEKTIERSPVQGLPGMIDLGEVIGANESQLMTDIVTQAYGTKSPQRKSPSSD